ncbi:MAG TPA: hypothetical protein VF188_06070 [Longimicrobiales bacterium]
MDREPVAPDPEHQARHRLIRRATWYTIGLFAAAARGAVGGAALIAWILSSARLRFLETWIALSILIPGIPRIGRAVEALRDGRGIGAGDRDDGGGGTEV